MVFIDPKETDPKVSSACLQDSIGGLPVQARVMGRTSWATRRFKRDSHPWSAAFISWIMKTAGAGNASRRFKSEVQQGSIDGMAE